MSSQTSSWISGIPSVPSLQQDLITNGAGAYPNRVFASVFGRAPVVNNVRIDLWEGPTGTYVFPPSPIQMRVVSSSANDTAAGTGTQQVIIHYLDTNYTVQSETVTLNGVTPVNTVATNILRVNAMHVFRSGTGGTSAGNISLTNTAGTVTYGFITAGYNTARQAIYTIPAGKTGFISHWQGSSGAATGTHFTQVDLRATAHEGVLLSGVFLVQDSISTLNGGQTVTFPIPILIPAQADVKISATSDAANAAAIATGIIMGWLE